MRIDSPVSAILNAGSFTLGATASTTVNNANAKTTSRIFIFPTNAAAAANGFSAKAPYVSSKANGSFIVSTGNATAALGTETYDYLIVG